MMTAHFAHANGYPPELYQPFLHTLTLPVVAPPNCALWPNTPIERVSSWQTIADDIIAYLQQEPSSHPVVGIGHSLGAVATLYAAHKRPDLFSHLVLIEPVFFSAQFLAAWSALPDPLSNPLVRTALRRRHQWPTREEAFAHFRPKAVFSRLSDEALQLYVQYALKSAEPPDSGFTLRYPREWEAHIYTLRPSDVWEILPQITHPTLALRGAWSDTLLPEAWQLWQEAQPTAQFHNIAETGHLLPLEQPQQLGRLINEWLATS